MIADRFCQANGIGRAEHNRVCAIISALGDHDIPPARKWTLNNDPARGGDAVNFGVGEFGHFVASSTKDVFDFRPFRSAQDAVRAGQGFVAAGKKWVVDIDLKRLIRSAHPPGCLSAVCLAALGSSTKSTTTG